MLIIIITPYWVFRLCNIFLNLLQVCHSPNCNVASALPKTIQTPDIFHLHFLFRCPHFCVSCTEKNINKKASYSVFTLFYFLIENTNIALQGKSILCYDLRYLRRYWYSRFTVGRWKYLQIAQAFHFVFSSSLGEMLLVVHVYSIDSCLVCAHISFYCERETGGETVLYDDQDDDALQVALFFFL